MRIIENKIYEGKELFNVLNLEYQAVKFKNKFENLITKE